MQIVLIVPGLLAFPADELATARSLGRLAARAGTPRTERLGIGAALFAALGVAAGTPVAPLALSGAGGDPRDDYVLCADPVHLAADRDDVVLVERIDDLSREAADALVRMLDRHFADDDLRFEAVRPDAWFVRCRRAPEIATTPLDVARGRSLFAQLPSGADGGRWNRWQNEIGMLLHEHAVNAAREARGEAAMNGVWFWGGGCAADVGVLPMTAVAAAPGHVGDIARGIARHGHGTLRTPDGDDALMSVLAATNDGAGPAMHEFALAVLPAAHGALARFEALWLAPALDLLARHRIAALHVIADGGGCAFTWTARPASAWQRLRSRIRPPAFTVPRNPDA